MRAATLPDIVCRSCVRQVLQKGLRSKCVLGWLKVDDVDSVEGARRAPGALSTSCRVGERPQAFAFLFLP